MVKPRALRPGDRVAIVAPASPFGPDEFEAGVAEVRALGFEPVYEARVFSRRGYVAGAAAERAAALEAAWRDPHVAGILTARGGYGSAQVLPYLDAAVFARAPKVFLGYSDLTAILSFLTCRCGVVAFHGPSVAGRLSGGDARYDRASLLSAVSRAAPLGDVSAPGLDTLVSGEGSGPLVGGTLTQLAASLGTPYAFTPPAGAILFLEDVGERPYRIDRLLTQLIQAGVLREARGILLGTFPGCDEPDGRVTARAALQDVLGAFPGPVVFGYPSGHVDGPARTLPLGVSVHLVAADAPRVIVEEAAVEDEGPA